MYYKLKAVSFFMLFLSSSIFLYAQDTSKINPLRRQLSADSAHIYRFKKVRPQASIDNRNGIGGTALNVSGLSAGILLNEKYSMGIGVYKVLTELKPIPVTIKNRQTIYNRNLNLSYITGYFEFSIIDTRYWELGIPIELGVGGFNVTVKDSLKNKIIYQDKGGFIPIQIGLDLSFKPTKYFGLNLLGGYRDVLDKRIKKYPNLLNFNGAFYSFGVNFYFHEIITDSKYYMKRKKFRQAVKKLSS
jgi:hypothetical protein